MAKKNVAKMLKEAQENKTILKAIVKLAKINENDVPELVMDIDGFMGIITKSEVDSVFEFKSLISFVGTTVPFIVKEVHKDYAVCSRAEAQRIVGPEIMKKLKDGESFDGKIINILRYGAYVDIDGVAGLLKNTDFADDYTAINDLHNVGDTIKVKMKGNSSGGKLLFEAVTKYVSPTVVTPDVLEQGQVVMGVIRNIQPWGIFVNIAPGLDALVDSEYTDIEEDQKVRIRIKSIKNDGDKLKVRGKIVSLLDRG